MSKDKKKDEKKDKKKEPSKTSWKKEKFDLTAYHDKPMKDLLDEIVGLYQEGVAGNGTSAEKALALLELARQKTEKDDVIDAYFAGANMLMGRYAKSPVEKGKSIYRGLSLIDDVVKRDPDNLKVRMIRGYACLYLPTYYNRISTAIEDMEYLIKRYESDPAVFSEAYYQRLQNNLEEARKAKADIPEHAQRIMDSFKKRDKDQKEDSEG